MTAALGFSSASAQLNYYSADIAIVNAEIALFEVAPQLRIEIGQRCKNEQQKLQKEIKLGLYMGGIVSTAIESVRKLPMEDFLPQLPRLQVLAQEMATTFHMDSFIKKVTALVESGPTMDPATAIDDPLAFA
ncbi:MAG TPA: hypothetical protein VMR37_02915 [Rhabdochlamydiaceae bacterium]|nr:hypothetical protein [Rhabdochlamydiaceae bacterium]